MSSRAIRTDEPTLLAIGWGIIATWWVGLLLGVPPAVVARAGTRPKRSVGSLVRPMAYLLGVVAFCSLMAAYLVGLVGGIVVMFVVWRSRGKAAAAQDAEPVDPAAGGTREGPHRR